MIHFRLLKAMLCLAFVVSLMSGCAEQKSAPSPFDAYAKGHQQLIFKTVSFSQYIVKGTKDSVKNKHLEKRKVFLLQGTGKFYFDLGLLEQDMSKDVDPEHPTLYLKVKKGSHLPKYLVSMDVDIDNYYPVEEVDPIPITNEEARTIAKLGAVFTGGLGAYVGGKLAKEASDAIVMNPIQRLGVVAGSGALIGTVSGVGGYIRTKNFLCGKMLTSTDGPKEVAEFINEAKAIIAAELLDLSEEGNDPAEQFEKEIHEQLSLIMADLGWEKTVINFK